MSLFTDDNPLEKEIEAYFRNRIKANGGEAYKFSSPARRGVPDRLVVLPNGEVYFVEFKRKGKPLTVGQKAEHDRLSKLNQRCFVIDSKDGVDKWLRSHFIGAKAATVKSARDAMHDSFLQRKA